MKNIIGTLLLVTMAHSITIAQPFQTVWENTDIQLPFLTTMAMVYANPPFLAYQSFDHGNEFIFVSLEGQGLDTFEMPGYGDAKYHHASQSFYSASTSASTDSAKITKFGLDGSVAWEQVFKIQPSYFTRGKTIEIFNNHIYMGYFLTDYAPTVPINANGFCIYDTEGNQDLCTELEYSPSKYEEIVRVMTIDSFGNIIALRIPTNFTLSGPATVIKFDGNSNTGSVAWTTELPMEETYSPSESALAVDKTGNIFVGTAFNRLFKLSPDGEIIYDRAIGSKHYHSIQEVLLPDDYLLLLGSWKPTADYDSVGGAYLAKVYAPTGEVVWETALPRLPEPTNIFYETFRTGVWAADTVLYCVYKTNSIARLCKLSLPNSLVETKEPLGANAGLTIFPNPAKHSIYINILGEEGNSQITLFNLLGQQMLCTSLSNGNSLDISQFRSGTYLLTATNPNGKVYTERFVKE